MPLPCHTFWLCPLAMCGLPMYRNTHAHPPPSMPPHSHTSSPAHLCEQAWEGGGRQEPTSWRMERLGVTPHVSLDLHTRCQTHCHGPMPYRTATHTYAPHLPHPGLTYAHALRTARRTHRAAHCTLHTHTHTERFAAFLRTRARTRTRTHFFFFFTVYTWDQVGGTSPASLQTVPVVVRPAAKRILFTVPTMWLPHCAPAPPPYSASHTCLPRPLCLPASTFPNTHTPQGPCTQPISFLTFLTHVCMILLACDTGAPAPPYHTLLVGV